MSDGCRSTRCHLASRLWTRPAGLRTTFWGGVAAPKATSAEIVGKLNKEINAGLAPSWKRGLPCWAARCFRAHQDFGKLIAGESEKWGKVVQAAGIKVE